MNLSTPQRLANNSQAMFQATDHRGSCEHAEENSFQYESNTDPMLTEHNQAKTVICSSCRKTMKWNGYVISFSVYKSLWRCSCGTTVCVIDM